MSLTLAFSVARSAVKPLRTVTRDELSITAARSLPPSPAIMSRASSLARSRRERPLSSRELMLAVESMMMAVLPDASERIWTSGRANAKTSTASAASCSNSNSERRSFLKGALASISSRARCHKKTLGTTRRLRFSLSR